jgi:hypothetical protein
VPGELAADIVAGISGNVLIQARFCSVDLEIEFGEAILGEGFTNVINVLLIMYNPKLPFT